MSGTVTPATGAAGAQPDANVAAQPALPPSQLVPGPDETPPDMIAQLYKLFSAINGEQVDAGKENVEIKTAEKKRRLDEYQAAVERARKAASEKHGFFDSIGLGGLIGIVAKSPILVIADMSMHMAHVTPDAIARFEQDNAKAISICADAYAAMGSAEILAHAAVADPRTLAATAALGGILIRDTDVFGEKNSDWVGTALMVTGAADPNAAAAAICARKDGVVADQIRDVEKTTEPYTKWAAYAGMAVAAVGACVATAGTATAAVVAIGIALSVSGVVIDETHCLDAVLGKKAAEWLGLGLTTAGALITGVGAAGATNATAQALEATGQAVQGGAEVRQGAEALAAAPVERDVALANADASEALNRARRLDRIMEDVVNELQELKERAGHYSKAVNAIEDTEAQTQLVAATGLKG